MNFVAYIKYWFLGLIYNARVRFVWEKLAPNFNVIEPPGRPSMGDAQNYRSALQAVSNPTKILVLGTTPEVRMVAADFTSHPLIADFSLPMIRATDIMLPRDVVQKEEKILINWLDLPNHIEPHSCDAVLGDLVVRQIFAASSGTFLKSIHAILRKEGAFVTRMNVRNEMYSKEWAVEIINEAARNVFVPNASSNIYTYMFRLYDACTDSASGSLSVGLVKRSFMEALELATDAGMKKNIKNIQKVIGKPAASWTHLTKKAIEETASEFFKIKNVLTSHDYTDSSFFPVYVFEAQ